MKGVVQTAQGFPTLHHFDASEDSCRNISRHVGRLFLDWQVSIREKVMDLIRDLWRGDVARASQPSRYVQPTIQ